MFKQRLLTYFKNIIGFFPLQLLLLHLKKSHLLIIIWLILFGFVSQNLAMKFGVPYLFLSPEYLGKVNWLSFLLLGFSVGGFFMAYHLYSYILLGRSFPFIATLGRPFYKFSINNSTIPILFYFVLVYNIFEVQSNEELREGSEILVDVLSLTGGIILFILLAVLYFFKTNWDISKLRMRREKRKRRLYTLVGSLFSRNNYWFDTPRNRVYQPSYYLTLPFKFHKARDASHYKKEVIRDVFRQNHLNASIFEVMIIISFVGLGFLQEYQYFQIPSSASFMLLFTFALMLLTIFYSWFNGWALSLIAIIFLVLNLISIHGTWLQPKNYAYGLSYANKADYQLDNLKEIQHDSADYQFDVKHHEAILDRWHKKASELQGTDKPKLILINCSGGGLRSAMWTFYILQQLDVETNGKFMACTHMITGASGGMIGASYYRQLFLDAQKSEMDLSQEKYLTNISKDLLNRVAFNIATHDIFLRYRKFNLEGKEYLKDRGYSFETQLNENTEFVMDKELNDYFMPEYKSRIPLMIFSPTIINDGRRMIIGSQPYGFLNGPYIKNKVEGPENVEYTKLFAKNQAGKTRFTTVLRMNSTFPYILPMVTLPTKPEIQVMDAGIRDNYGAKTTVRYIKALEAWLKENTSGIVLVEIRDINKDYDIDTAAKLTLFDRLMKPLSNFYGNYHHAQEFNSIELIESIQSSDLPIELITFQLRKDPSEMISLSWHLTQREKNDIKRIFQNEKNQTQLEYLIDLLEPN